MLASMTERLRAHRRWCQEHEGRWGDHRSAWQDRMWDTRDLDAVFGGTKNGAEEDSSYPVKVQVSHVRKFVRSNVDHTFYRGVTTSVGRDELEHLDYPPGSEIAMQRIIQALAERLDIEGEIDRAMSAALLYDHAGLAVGWDPSPDIGAADSVWVEARMPWQCVWDRTATSPTASPYMGTIMSLHRDIVKARWGTELEAAGIDVDKLPGHRDADDAGRTTPAGAAQGDYVDVLEMYDFVAKHKDGTRGTMSIHIVTDDESTLEVSVAGCGYRFLSGHPSGALVPLVLEALPERPLEGHPQVSTVFEASAEMSVAATVAANTMRRSAERVLIHNEKLTRESRRKIGKPGDLKWVEIAGSNPSANVSALVMPDVGPGIYQYWRQMDDSRRSTADTLGPFATGEPTRYVTASQTNQLGHYTENALGHVRRTMDKVVVRVLELALQALAHAMTARGVPSLLVEVDGQRVMVAADMLTARWSLSVSDIAPTPIAEAGRREAAKDAKPLFDELVVAIATEDTPPLVRSYAEGWYDYLHMLWRLPETLSLDQVKARAESYAPVEAPSPSAAAALAEEL